MFDGLVVRLDEILTEYGDNSADCFGFEEGNLIGTIDISEVEASDVFGIGLDDEVDFLPLLGLFW